MNKDKIENSIESLYKLKKGLKMQTILSNINFVISILSLYIPLQLKNTYPQLILLWMFYFLISSGYVIGSALNKDVYEKRMDVLKDWRNYVINGGIIQCYKCKKTDVKSFMLTKSPYFICSKCNDIKWTKARSIAYGQILGGFR